MNWLTDFITQLFWAAAAREVQRRIAVTLQRKAAK